MIPILTKLLTRQALSEFFWIGAGQIVYMVLGFFSVKLLTSMGPAKYGIYALMVTLSGIMSAVLYGPTEQGFTRYYFEYAHKGKARVLLRILYQFLAISALCLVAVGVFCYPITSGNKLVTSFLEYCSIVLFIIISACASPINSILNALRKRKENAFLQAIERGLVVLCLLILVVSFQLTIVSVFATLALAALAGIIARLKIIDRHAPKNDKGIENTKEKRREIARKIMVFSLPFIIWGSAGWLQSSSERWVIAHYLTITDVGRYAVMIALANYLIAVPHGIITLFVTPILYDKFSQFTKLEQLKEGYQYLNCLKIASIVLSICCILFTLLAGKSLLVFISDIEFAGSWYLLPIICVGLGLFYLGQMLSQLGIALKIPSRYIFPKIGSGVLALILNIICIKYAGLTGAAVSVLCVGGAYLLGIACVNIKIKSIATTDRLKSTNRFLHKQILLPNKTNNN